MAWLPLFRPAGGSAPIELAPDVAVAATSVVSPTLGYVYTLTPSPVVAVTSATSPAISHVFTLAPPPAVATTSVPVTEVGGPVATNLTPNPAVAATSVVAPVISHVYSLTASVAVSATSVPQSTVTTALTLTPTPSVAATSVPASVVTTVYGLNPSVAVTVSSVIAVTLTHALTLLPAPAVAVTSVVAPDITVPTNLTPSPAVATTSAPSPTVGLVNNIAPSTAVAITSGVPVTFAHALTLSVSPAIAVSGAHSVIMYAPVDEATLIVSQPAVEGADMSTQPRNTVVVSLLQTYLRTVLEDAPVGYWRLGESSGIVAADASGNGKNGTYVGSPTLGAAGAVLDSDTATLFGLNKYVAQASSLLPADSSFTFEAWVNPKGQGGAAVGAKGLIESTQIIRLMTLNPNPTDGRVGFNINYQATNSSFTQATSPTYLTGDIWFHVVGVHDVVADSLILYVDGVSVNQVAAPKVCKTNGGYQIARRDTSTWPDNVAIDEVAVYDTALSPARILAHYRAGKYGFDNAAAVIVQPKNTALASQVGETTAAVSRRIP